MTQNPLTPPTAQPTDLALPQVSPEQILEALDPEQRRVASEFGTPMCVLAGAGTGKTRAITHRIAYGIAIGRYKPNNVLALTFTTRAADEMRSRLRSLGVRGVQARTFHSAALRQLKYFWPSLVGGTPPQIINHKAQLITEAAARLRLTTDRTAIRDLAGIIEWAKVSLLTPDTILSRLVEKELPADISPLNMQRLFRTYEELKDERNIIDFEDVLTLTIAGLEDRPEIAASIREQYRHFVVDEYQDVSPLQQRLLNIWLGGRDDICVVGDASQTIYSFTGASSRYLLNFSKTYPGATVIKLIRDYRSTHPIVDAANKLLAARKPARDCTPGAWATPLHLESQRGKGAPLEFFEYGDDTNEAVGIAEDISDLIKDGVQPAEIAVLYRTNSQSVAIEQALTDAGIPYQMKGAEQFFQRGEVRNAMNALRGAAQAVADDPVPQATRDVLKSLGWQEIGPTTSGAVRQRWESLAALVSMADSMQQERDTAREQAGGEKDLPPLTMGEFVAHLFQRMALQEAPVMNGVTLASFHAAKGLEWDAVFLAGLSDGLVPIRFAETGDEIDEERRLLYVGITRARKYLTLTWSLSRTPGGRPHRQKSRFLAAIMPVQKRGGR